MSLTSRLSSLFASESLSHLVPASPNTDGDEREEEREDGANAEVDRNIERMRTVEKTEADEDLGLKRPPYTYVCLPEFIVLVPRCLPLL